MRSYEKSNPEKSATVPAQKFVDKTEASSPVSVKDAGTDYRKTDGFLSPKSLFVIVSGGERTERLYFKIISNQDKFVKIRIAFIADPKRLNPKGLLETAKYKQEYYRTSQENEADKIYIVSDVDDFMSELLIIKPECDTLNISLIISNSCFEIWLYYAWCNEITGFPVPANKSHISRDFRRWMPSRINPVKAILNIEQNIKNAKEHYKEDENGIPELFSTNMFMLAEDIFPLVESELKNINAEKARR
ncbi:MAG: RloB family protein [Prevotellaceae bacterium]|jgi:hypothetical protein|nr:RloB family protein [Prevotellaceae bacterium]